MPPRNPVASAFVNATYSTPSGHALVGSRLYIPAEQLADKPTRAQAGIHTTLGFKTKPELGLELLAEHLAAGISVPWCTADAVYGRDRSLRGFCERYGMGYVLGVPCSFQVALNPYAKLRVDGALKLLTGRPGRSSPAGRAPKVSVATPGRGYPPPAHVISC